MTIHTSSEVILDDLLDHIVSALDDADYETGIGTADEELQECRGYLEIAKEHCENALKIVKRGY